MRVGKTNVLYSQNSGCREVAIPGTLITNLDCGPACIGGYKLSARDEWRCMLSGEDGIERGLR